MAKIYVLVASQPNNLGDLIINRMLIAEILKYGEVYVDSYGLPQDFRGYLYFDERIIDVKERFGGTLKRFPPFKILKLIKKEGFTHFFKSPGPTGTSFNLNNLALAYIYNYMRSSKIVVNFVGIDLTSDNQLVFQLIKKGVGKFFVRSKQNISSLKDKSLDLAYIPDLALLYEPKDKLPKMKKIAISFRRIYSDYQLFLGSLNQVVSHLIKLGYEIEIFYQVKNDYDFNRQVYNDLKLDKIHFKEQCLWYDDLSYYADKSFVVSNRLHVLLVGLLYNALPVAYIDSHYKVKKIEDIFRSLKLDDFIWEIPAKIEIAENLFTNGDNSKRLQRILSENRALCQRAIFSIFD
jgi:hypothetical protein